MSQAVSTLKIRQATLKDKEALFALASTLASTFVLRREDFEKSLTQVLLDSEVFLGVAEWDNAVSGYILGSRRRTFHANGPIGWVEELMVSGPCQRNGIGSSLLAFFEGWARGKGCVLISLATRRSGTFYEHLGYAGHATYFRKVL